MNHKKILLWLPFFVIVGLHRSEASWIIDRATFHMSAHGRISCQECHEDVAGRDLHPNPTHVTKGLDDFFEPDQCYACHGDTREALDHSVHGSQVIETLRDYHNCLACHDPHEVLSSEVKTVTVDGNQTIENKCSGCHEKERALPRLSGEDEACMNCHGPARKESESHKTHHKSLCLHCHAKKGTPAQEITGQRLPLMDLVQNTQSSHADMDCTACHVDALEFKHQRQERVECRVCHLPHDEKVAHDAHMSVSCEACHLQGITPVRDPETRRIIWTWERDRNHEPGVHKMAWPRGDKGQCRRCHYSDNPLIAPSAVLPPKSVICMPCHAATLSLGDPLSIIGVVILLCGLLLSVTFWLTAAWPGHLRAKGVTKIRTSGSRSVTTPFSRKMSSVISILCFDVLLQRRLFGRSKVRWFAHGLIFYPCLFRFLWGLVVLFCSQLFPQWYPLGIMMDKNHPITAAFFDISGVLMLAGIILAFVRGRLNRPNLRGIPSQDLMALSLLAAIVIVGFGLEGMRMAMAGLPESGFHAPIGYFLSKLFSKPSHLIDVYGNVWYAHVAMTAAFVAYLPFSRMRHIIMAPLMLTAGSVKTSGGGKKSDHVYIKL